MERVFMLRGNTSAFGRIGHLRRIKASSVKCSMKKSNTMRSMTFINNTVLPDHDIDRVIEMAWEDRTPFEAIEFQFGLDEQDVIELMRREIKPKSFRMWRKRVQGRKTKHSKLRLNTIGRFKCSRQRSITNNKISKR
ncbi:MAG: TIGR03643 family protein [Flavobacteriaceae bacterium]|nr:TIGR03643 family protein [Flavobacteriaceae bacterium]